MPLPISGETLHHKRRHLCWRRNRNRSDHTAGGTAPFTLTPGTDGGLTAWSLRLTSTDGEDVHYLSTSQPIDDSPLRFPKNAPHKRPELCAGASNRNRSDHTEVAPHLRQSHRHRRDVLGWGYYVYNHRWIMDVIINFDNHHR